MIKNILVPTDFSKNAAHALQYAVIIARQTKAKITLLHTWLPVPGEPAWSVIDSPSLIKEKFEKKLAQLCERYKNTYRLRFDYVCQENRLSTFITETVKRKKINLIVMGTVGKGKQHGKVMGSNAAHMISKAPCPLIVVPEKAVLAIPKNIVFATDYYDGEVRKIKQLLKYTAAFKPALEVLHVCNVEDTGIEKHFLDEFAARVRKSMPKQKIYFKLVTGKKVADTLVSYTKKHETDMLVMDSARLNFIERLFAGSITKKLSYQTSLPLFVFHKV